MTHKAMDAGRVLLEAITEWAKASSVPLVYGHVPPTLPSIEVELDQPDSVAAQLERLLTEANPYLVVASTHELTAEELEANLELLEAEGAEAITLAEVKGCDQFIGHFVSLTLTAFLKGGPVSLAYNYVAEWSNVIYRDEDDDSEGIDRDFLKETRAAREAREQQYREAQEERARWTAAARSDAARRIAADVRFPKAKTEAARVFLAREVLGADVPKDDYMVKEISREAKAIFDFGLSKDE